MKIQNIILAMLASCFIFISCDKDKGNTTGSAGQTIYVKVENASEYSNIVEVRFMTFDKIANRYVELAHGDWKDGGFTIELPKMLDANFLYALIDDHVLPTTIISSSTATINNKNAKVGDAYFYGFDRDGNMVIGFLPLKIDEDIIDPLDMIHYRYVDSDVTISGYAEHSYGNFNMTNVFSIEWKKGWNISWISASELEGRTIHKWSTIPFNRLTLHGVALIEVPPIIIN